MTVGQRIRIEKDRALGAIVLGTINEISEFLL